MDSSLMTSSLESTRRFSERIRQFNYQSNPSSHPASPPLAAPVNSKSNQNATTSPSRSATSSPLKRSYTQALQSSPSRASAFPQANKKARKSSTASPKSSRYAPPSTYAHLPPLTDVLAPNLLILFVGLNPGITTATSGHAYAHPSNWFWRLLHLSGLTPERRLDPSEDVDLPRLYGYGNTNIVSRPTRDQGELKREEMVQGTAVLEAKVRQWRPEVVCLVGKGIWEAVWRWRHGRNLTKSEFNYGWQSEGENMGRLRAGNEDEEGSDWKGARIFVATSTSGQAANLRPKEKEEIWRSLGEWSQKRRAERRRVDAEGASIA